MRPNRSVSWPKNSAPMQAPATYVAPAAPIWKLDRPEAVGRRRLQGLAHRADDGDLEPVEDPHRAEPDHHQPVPAAPRQPVEPGRDVGGDPAGLDRFGHAAQPSPVSRRVTSRTRSTRWSRAASCDVAERDVAVGAGAVRDAVRVAVLELHRVGVAGRHQDPAEVVDRVVERQQRRLLAAVVGLRGGEPGVHLVGELALAPLRSEGVEVLLELAGDVAEAGRRAEQHGVGPHDVVRRRASARPGHRRRGAARHSGIESTTSSGASSST